MQTNLDLQNTFSRTSSHLTERLKERHFHKVSSSSPDFVDLVDHVLADAPTDMQTRLRFEWLEYGPLNQLVSDTTITEIIVNGPDSIWFEKDGQLQKHHDQFLSPLTYNNIVQRICDEARITVDQNQPAKDGRWNDFRLHVLIPPIAKNSTSLCLRRHPRRPWTLDQLQDLAWGQPSALAYLKSCLQTKKNLLVAGPTGSGKTSVLNALLQEVPGNDRVVVIEDTDEIHCPNKASVKLLTRTSCDYKAFSQMDLVIQALRMRPNRLVMGEVRGEEAKDLLMALATGHKGSFFTLHASDPRQALWRLEMLIQLGAPQWGIDAIRGLIKLSLDELVIVRQDTDGRRVLEGIYKIQSLEPFGFILEKIM